MKEDLFPRFESFVKAQQLLNKEKTVVTGFSGGADSTALLLLLLELAKTQDIHVVAVHVNHGIRGAEADADEAFARRFCEERKLLCIVEKINVPEICRETKESEEEAARRLRYEIFCRIARERNAVIAVAHHKDDNAETILLNLIRGSKVKGLSGMQPAGEKEGIKLIRPLLPFRREEIECYLKENGIAFCRDSTNEDAGYARNRIRKNVTPQLEIINEKAVCHICESAEFFHETEAFLERQTQKVLKEAVSFTPGETVLLVSKLKEADPLLRKRAILSAIARAAGSRKDITARHVKSVEELLSLQSGKMVNLPYKLIARRQYDEIRIERTMQQEGRGVPFSFRMKKDEAGNEWTMKSLQNDLCIAFRTVCVDESNRDKLMEKNQYTKAFDYDKIANDIIVGQKAPGDGIFLREGRKTVKKFFIDEKIPADRREQILLVKDEKDVLWIAGYRISEKHKITETTTKGLLIKLIGGNHEC